MEVLQYNTDRTQLIIPEYGRHVQIMVNQLKVTQDRDERNKMARAIIGIMGNMNPHLRDVPDFQHKLWDQLFIMSDFELDLDSPFEKPQRELLMQKPERLNYPKTNLKYRFYGNNIKNMIYIAKDWDEGDMKNALIFNIANHMKKCFLNWNKDTVQDEVILKHLTELSDGKLIVSESDLPLTDSSELLKNRNKNGNSSKNNHKQRNKRNNGRKRY